MSTMGHRAMRLLTAALLAAALVGGPGRASADAALERAKALYKRAEGHFGAGSYDQALQLYKQAYSLKPLPGFLFNLGQCERKLGRCDRALVHFREYLGRLPDAPNKEVVLDLIRECEAVVGRAAPPKQPEPEPVREDPLAATGEPEQTAPLADEAKETTVTATPSPAEPGERAGLHPAWFWSTAGLAVALVAAGTVTGVITLDKSAEYKEQGTTDARRRELKDSADVTGNISTVGIIAGAAAAVAAGVIFFYTGWEAPSTTQVSAGPTPGGGGALLLRTTF